MRSANAVNPVDVVGEWRRRWAPPCRSRRPSTRGRWPAPATARIILPPAPTLSGRRGGYGRAALAQERAAVAGASPGRRNASLNRAAFNLANW
jgi:hypothetical protein